jgi:hypothetical protein
MWLIGPERTAKLATVMSARRDTEGIDFVFTQTLPVGSQGYGVRIMNGHILRQVRCSMRYLKARANFPGRRASSGSVKNATMKQTADPSRHAPKPNRLEGKGIIQV